MDCTECNGREIVEHNGDRVLCECVDLMEVLQEALHLRDYHRKGQLIASLQYCHIPTTDEPYMVVWNATVEYPYRQTVFCKTCEEADEYVMMEMYSDEKERRRNR